MDWRIAFGAVAFVTLAGSASAAVVISDASFESPALPSQGYEYGVQNGAQHSSDGTDAAATGMTFSNGAGVQANGSAWGFANAPNGVQTAFLQSYNNQVPGTITQDVTGLTVGQKYTLTLDLSDRPGFGVDPVTIQVGGDVLGTFTPAGNTWAPVTTGTFTATAENDVISYSVAANAGDVDIGLDNVSIAAVPEPMTWALSLFGVAMAGGWLRASRRTVSAVARA
jgi:hypothetical protein